MRVYIHIYIYIYIELYYLLENTMHCKTDIHIRIIVKSCFFIFTCNWTSIYVWIRLKIFLSLIYFKIFRFFFFIFFLLYRTISYIYCIKLKREINLKNRRISRNFRCLKSKKKKEKEKEKDKKINKRNECLTNLLATLRKCTVMGVRMITVYGIFS